MEQLSQAILVAAASIIIGVGVLVVALLRSSAKAAERKEASQAFILEQAEKLSGFQSQLNDIVKENAANKSKLDITQFQLDATKENLEKEVKHSREQDTKLGEFSEYKRNAEGELQRLRDAKNKADQQLTNLQRDLNDRSEVNAQTKEENRQLVEERKKLIEQVGSLEEKVSRLEKDILDIRSDHHRQVQDWQTTEVIRHAQLQRTRFALRSLERILTDDQRLAIEKTLMTKDISFGDLITPGGDAEPPDVDERIQQLKQMNAFHSHETRALITALSERGAQQSEITHILDQAHERWQGVDEKQQEPTALEGAL